MKKIFLFLIIIAAITIAFFMMRKTPTVNKANPPVSSNQNESPSQNSQNVQEQNIKSNQNTNNFQPPLDRASERVTKKPFGIYITPKTSPVQPEKFQGYHTGTDFEIFPEELNIDVPVHAVCNGKIILKEYASGYGGVAIESCELDSQPITVVYGHLNLASINLKAGDSISAGDLIGNLGNAYSTQTDGERKHLHLGFHKGSATNILGYVNLQSQLSDWIDPCLYACK
jgi:murein DD-endopeptidase MepM/ murein hydrolase activator NlpD